MNSVGWQDPQPAQLAFCRPAAAPAATRTCPQPGCDARYTWQAETWGACAWRSGCGVRGRQERKVRCKDGTTGRGVRKAIAIKCLRFSVINKW